MTDLDRIASALARGDTLTATLRALGLRHEPVGRGVHAVINEHGAEVTRGRAWQVWEWLREVAAGEEDE